MPPAHSDIIPAPGWEEVLEQLDSITGTAMVVGAVDAGKSTLVRWLVASLLALGRRIALVDSDVGQSSLCLPGTVAMMMLSPADTDYRCGRFRFLGSASPAKIVYPLVEATGRLAAEGLKGADLVLVDTSGLVEGEIGRGLKMAKVRMLRPQAVIALQRDSECEHILSLLDRVVIYRLHPSPLVSPRSRDRRGRYRNERLLERLSTGEVREFYVAAGEKRFFRFGREAGQWDTVTPLTVVGLDSGFETLELGLVTEADPDSITFVSPIRNLAGVRSISYGDIILDTAGNLNFRQFREKP